MTLSGDSLLVLPLVLEPGGLLAIIFVLAFALNDVPDATGVASVSTLEKSSELSIVAHETFFEYCLFKLVAVVKESEGCPVIALPMTVDDR